MVARSPSLTGGERVFGLETEYIVSFLPAREEPQGWLLLNAVEEAILKAGRVCEAAGGGYFLANGGAVSFESRWERRDNPVLELATPECSDPWEVLTYVRAQELFLHAVAERAEASLRRHGFPGRVIFGRSNRDWQGARLGSHENYWIKGRDAWPTALAAVALAFVCGVAIGALNQAFVLAAHVLTRLQTLLRRALRRKAAGRRVIAFSERGRDFWKSSGLPMPGFLTRCLYEVLLRTVVGCCERVLDRVLVRRLRKGFLPFLATRQLFSGAGALVFGASPTPLHLSARAADLTRVGGISFGQRSKAVFDLKPFLRDPLGALRDRKRLCVAGGDSLMSETALFLALGTTSLVLTMLEEGEEFPELELDVPIAAWRAISAGGPLTPVGVRGKHQRAALEIQRSYLARAQTFFADAPPGSLPDQILRLWEGALECLGENPANLWGQVDWVTKKLLLDRIVFPQAGWREFARSGVCLTEIKRALPRAMCLSSVDGATASLYMGPWRRRLFKSFLGDAALFARRRATFLAAAKLDARYHEISRHGGYFEQLRAAGDVPLLVDDEEAEVARVEPPSTTRAAIRGRAIALAADPRDIEASWDTIRVNSLNLSVTIRDPFARLDVPPA